MDELERPFCWAEYFSDQHKRMLREAGLPEDFDVGPWLAEHGGLGIDKDGNPVMSKRLKKATRDLRKKYPRT